MSGNTTVGRRAVLALAGSGATLCAAALGGCGLAADPQREEDRRRDDQVRRESLASELRLIAAYDAAIAAAPGDAALLVDYAAQHRAHAEALGGADASVPPEASGSEPQLTADQLATLEHEAAGLRAGASVRAGSPDLAALLCWIGCSEAQHAATLGAGS